MANVDEGHHYISLDYAVVAKSDDFPDLISRWGGFLFSPNNSMDQPFSTSIPSKTKWHNIRRMEVIASKARYRIKQQK